jgi:subfamily B ATP-binding cassette protein MsbA
LPASATAVYLRLLGYARPYRRVVAAAIAATAVHAAADAAVPLLMEQIIARLQDVGRGSEGAWRIPLAIAVLFPIRGAMDFLAVYGLGWVGRSVIRDLRSELFGHYLELPASYYDGGSTGELISKLTYNCEQIAEAVSNAILIVVRDTLVVLLLLAIMIYMSLQLTLLLGILVPTIGLLVKFASKALRRYSTRIQTSMGDVTRIAEQSLQGHRMIKVFGGEVYEEGQFGKINTRNFVMNTRLAAVRAIADSLTQLAVAIGVASVIFVVLSGWAFDTPDPAAFIGFIAAMGMLLAPLKRLMNVNAMLQRGIAAADSVFEILEQPAESQAGEAAAGRVGGGVEYRGVSFCYHKGRERILDDVSIAVPAGSSLALVGQSGSGKTTLVNLLPRFYEVDGGSILLDGRDIRSYKLSDLRCQLSLVAQDTVLFDDSIANNIAYGALAVSSRAAIEGAAEAAYVTEFAAKLPGGLDARVGERGVLLSGGQRQRIAIARALLKDAPVLILDEATSALDTESERRIQQALVDLMKGRTTLVIAHRLSTVEKVDRIAVMKDGRIVEQGTHRELLARGGYYATVYGLQFADSA